MTKLRVLIFLLTVVVVGTVGVLATLYATGYRINKNNKVTSDGLLVANSDPNGAQILINGQLNSATNATISLAAGNYDVSIKKDGYLLWGKKVRIDSGVVTEVDASLFPIAASLNPLTFSGAINPVVSPDYSKISYGDIDGLWVLETINLPLGFNSQPIKITDLKIDSTMSWEWSPDARQILLTTRNGIYLLDAGTLTAQLQLVDITSTVAKTRQTWKDIESKQLTSLLSKLPDQLAAIFQNNTTNVSFSPDQTKILYTATDSASIPLGIIPPLPGSSTQVETRNITKGGVYVFDLKEDRNFQITDVSGSVYWFASSRNLLIPEKDKVVICDYDNTNKQSVYGGSYVYPVALPTPNINRIFILTNLGAAKASPNLYSLNLR